MSTFSEDYYKNTNRLKPSPLLIDALNLLTAKSKVALDLGCGAGRDTKLLLESGFQVTAVDSEPLVEPYIKSLSSLGDVTYINSTFEDFTYKHYDLINAHYSLPFNPPKSFPLIIDRVSESLNSGGVFVGQIFGINDEWNTKDKKMTFHTKQEVIRLFSSLEVIKFLEKEEDGFLANGSKKHWHVFDIIARQR